jgi:hypothetical protein
MTLEPHMRQGNRPGVDAWTIPAGSDPGSFFRATGAITLLPRQSLFQKTVLARRLDPAAKKNRRFPVMGCRQQPVPDALVSEVRFFNPVR